MNLKFFLELAVTFRVCIVQKEASKTSLKEGQKNRAERGSSRGGSQLLRLLSDATDTFWKTFLRFSWVKKTADCNGTH